jgi:signal transduction histidine kinase
MHERIKRILIAVALGLIVAAVNSRLDVEFAHLAVPTASTLLNDVIVGFVAALCGYGWASLLAERHSRRILAEKLRQEGELRERTRIAHEIHDTLAQGFAGMIINLEAAGEFLDEGSAARKFFENALRIGRDSLAEARALLHGLRPPALDQGGLRRAIVHLADTLTQSAGLDAECHVEELPAQLPPKIEAELFRIIQEAITNTVKHAQATQVRVLLRAQDNELQLRVEDDGRGFAPQPPATETGYGLATMRERAKELGAALQVHSRPGQGTRVIAFIPIPNGTGRIPRSPMTSVPVDPPSPTTVGPSPKS